MEGVAVGERRSTYRESGPKPVDGFARPNSGQSPDATGDHLFQDKPLGRIEPTVDSQRDPRILEYQPFDKAADQQAGPDTERGPVTDHGVPNK